MIRAGVLAACVLLAGCATSARVPPVAPTPGYLDAGAIGALAGASGAPTPLSASDPLPGVPGTDRWWLAIAHAELRPPEAAQHFDCALGTRLAQHPRPALSRVMNRLLVDVDRLTRAMAEAHPRPRPIRSIAGLEPCQRVDDAVRDSASWPAGGAVAGAAYGQLFAALAPDRAGEARRIGREIGLSRAVCRMNWTSDVTDGATAGERLYTAAAGAEDFAADLEAARAEITAARAEGLTHPACAAERRALSQAGRGAASPP
ncbi:MAG: PA-phosphatase [Brevundimonas sp.]